MMLVRRRLVPTREAHSQFGGRITVHPDLLNGKPAIRGKRIAVQTVLEFLAAGESREEILRQYPSLEPEDIDACLSFAAELMGHGYTLERIA
jgi:uncharacterized protein (DUF433 family)